MNFLKKINNFNQYISFQLFGFNGFLCAIIFLLLIDEYRRQTLSSSVTWGDAYFWYSLCLNTIIFSIFTIALIIFLLEQGFGFKIKNKFLVENKILKTIRYIGATISLIYLSCFLFICFYGFICIN